MLDRRQINLYRRHVYLIARSRMRVAFGVENSVCDLEPYDGQDHTALVICALLSTSSYTSNSKNQRATVPNPVKLAGSASHELYCSITLLGNVSELNQPLAVISSMLIDKHLNHKLTASDYTTVLTSI